MKDITDVLEDIATRGPPVPMLGGVSVYVVIDDHTSTDPPQVTTYHAGDRELARSSRPSLVRSILERTLDGAIAAWRAEE